MIQRALKMKFLLSIVLLNVLICSTDAALEKPVGCGSDIGCYSDCDGACKFVVTWKENGGNVDFTLSLTLDSGGADQWIALGLSSDTQMGSDSVTECIMNKNAVTVEKSYNPGKYNQLFTEETAAGLTNVQGRATDGVLTCSYTQTKTSSNDKIFDLNTDWNLLVAYGESTDGIKSQHSFDPLPSISPGKVNLLSTDDVHGNTDAALEKPAGCGSDVGCYSDCDGTCKFVVTWKENGGNVDFTLGLTLDSGGADQWIALGLSSDTQMGSDSVTECIMNTNAVSVEKSYNPGKYNQPFTEETAAGLTNVQGSATDGVLTCSYTQTKTSSNDKIFDLNTDWNLLVAYGEYTDGMKSTHSFDPLPSISPKKVDLLSTDDVSGTTKAILVKVHGALMMIAWIFCASIGIVLARHYKPMWPNSKVLDEKVWFTFHRICMGSALLTCAAAFIIIFVDVKDWSELKGSTNWQRAHPYIGCIVTFFVILNPIMAVFRPHPDARNRYIFSWAHWLVGTLAQILSAMALILGVTLARASVPFYCVWVLVAWVAYQMLMELILELLDCCVADNSRRYCRDGSLKDPRGSVLKKILLGIHVIVITGFTGVCIVIVAIN